MTRHWFTVGAAIAATMFVTSFVVRGNRNRAVAPAYSIAQQYEAGQLVVSLPHELTHRFTFRNTTHEPLEITAIKPSCGCTDVQAPNRLLEPGESAWIDVTATLFGTGPFTTDVAVHWSTGETTRFMVGVFAQIDRELFLSTSSVDLDVNQSQTMILSYVDQAGVPPGEVVIGSSTAVSVRLSEWSTVVEANADYGIGARYAATVEVELTEEIDALDRISFSLASMPELGPADLVVRTPALVETHLKERRPRRPSSGPILIQHDSDEFNSSNPPSKR